MPGRPVAAPPGHRRRPATCCSPPTGSACRPGWPPSTWRYAPARRSPSSGPNGAGKSTLALLLGGLLAPGPGRVAATTRWPARTRHSPAPLAGRRRWPAGSARSSRTRSTSSSPTRVSDELALGPRRTGQPEPAVRATVDGLLDRLRLTKLAARQPVHPLRRRGAAAERGDRPGHRAPPARLRRTDLRPGPADLAGAGRPLRRAARRRARRGRGHPRRRTSSPRWPTATACAPVASHTRRAPCTGRARTG